MQHCPERHWDWKGYRNDREFMSLTGTLLKWTNLPQDCTNPTVFSFYWHWPVLKTWSFEFWISTASGWLSCSWPRQGLGVLGAVTRLLPPAFASAVPLALMASPSTAWAHPCPFGLLSSFRKSLPFPSRCFLFQNFPHLSGQRGRSLPYLHHLPDGFFTAGDSSVASSSHLAGIRNLAPTYCPTSSLPSGCALPKSTSGSRIENVHIIFSIK